VPPAATDGHEVGTVSLGLGLLRQAAETSEPGAAAAAAVKVTSAGKLPVVRSGTPEAAPRKPQTYACACVPPTDILVMCAASAFILVVSSFDVP
jgi:hypothetical protein